MWTLQGASSTIFVIEVRQGVTLVGILCEAPIIIIEAALSCANSTLLDDGYNAYKKWNETRSDGIFRGFAHSIN